MKNAQRLRAMERHTGQEKSCPFCSVRGQRLGARDKDHSSLMIEARCDTCGEPFQIRIVYDEGSKRRLRNDERLLSIVFVRRCKMSGQHRAAFILAGICLYLLFHLVSFCCICLHSADECCDELAVTTFTDGMHKIYNRIWKQ